MNINLNTIIPDELSRHFVLTVYPDGAWKMTERRATRRDKRGHYTSDYAIRFRARANRTCAYAPICPFRASTSIEEL